MCLTYLETVRPAIQIILHLLNVSLARVLLLHDGFKACRLHVQLVLVLV